MGHSEVWITFVVLSLYSWLAAMFVMKLGLQASHEVSFPP